MNDTIELLAGRRSVPPHLMQGEAPAGAELDRLLTLAARVPDHGKLAPWRFILFSGEARERAGAVIANAFRADNPQAGEERVATEAGRLTRAPLVVGVVSRPRPHAKIPEWEQVLSAGAVCMNLTVAANAMRYRTAWLTEWFGYDRRVLDAFGLEPTERMAGFIHIGRSEATPPDRDRPVLADIVTVF